MQFSKILFYLVAAYVLFNLFSQNVPVLIKDIGLVINSNKTKGEVTNVDVRYCRSSRNCYYITVRFKNSLGENSTFQTIYDCNTNCPQIGDVVPVLYSKNNPAMADVDQGYGKYFPVALTVIIGIVFVLQMFKVRLHV